MSHRRKCRPGRHEPEPKRRPLSRAVRGHPRAAVAAAVVVALVVLIGVLVATTPRPREFYVQCFENGTYTVRQHIHFNIYIQLGEREPGSLASDFIRIPDDMGVRKGCMWPVHQHNTTGERDGYYTRIHVEGTDANYRYTLGDMFYVWGKWLDYPRGVHFAADGVSYYRSADMELLVHRGPVIDPHWNQYTSTIRSYAYGAYAPADGDYVEIIVHAPYETLADPY